MANGKEQVASKALVHIIHIQRNYLGRKGSTGSTIIVSFRLVILVVLKWFYIVKFDSYSKY